MNFVSRVLSLSLLTLSLAKIDLSRSSRSSTRSISVCQAERSALQGKYRIPGAIPFASLLEYIFFFVGGV